MKPTRNKRSQAAWDHFESLVYNPSIVRPGEDKQLIAAGKKLLKAHQRAALPKGGNDAIQTPLDLAAAIVDHFKPYGYCLEPCEGRGAFTAAMTVRHEVTLVQTYEITTGTDFLTADIEQAFNWCITNPPWSKFTAFLEKALPVCHNIVFLDKMNAWGFTGRLNKIHAAGFALVELARVKQPKKPWPSMGMALACGHLRRLAPGEPVPAVKMTHINWTP